MTPMAEVPREFAERLHAVGCPVTFEPMCTAPRVVARFHHVLGRCSHDVAVWAFCEFGLDGLDVINRLAPNYLSCITEAWKSADKPRRHPNETETPAYDHR